MRTKYLLIMTTIFLSMVGTKAFAYDEIAVENADGVTIYYQYINDGTEFEVVHLNNGYYPNEYRYKGNVVIPEEVVYMNRSRKVTSIGMYAFSSCDELPSVTLPNTIKNIGTGAFEHCSLSSLIIPSGVKTIGREAFSSSKLTSISIPNEVIAIEDETFKRCESLTSVTIGNGVTSIGKNAFENCVALTSVTIPNSVTSIGDFAFDSCYGLTSLVIGNNVTSIERYAFYGCEALTSIHIPNSVKTIGEKSFSFCENVTSLTIDEGVTSIGAFAFENCNKLSSVTIPNSLTDLEECAFYRIDFQTVISKIAEPFWIQSMDVFSNNTYKNATLYVPVGTIQKYRAISHWNQFLFIEEGNGPNGGGDATERKKCATPTISYHNGKLTFNSDTEGAICYSTITDDDIKSFDGNEVQLGVTYNISVYAAKNGYQNSETSHATLCWIDVEPKTEGITDGIAQTAARAVMVKAEGGQLTIEGGEDNTNISVYSIDGVQVGTTTSWNGVASVMTAIPKNSVAIVKIGNKSVKVMMK